MACLFAVFTPLPQIKRLTDQVAQLQKIIQQDDMKQMMMDFASTTQAELEAERGELQVALFALSVGLIALVLLALVHCKLFCYQTKLSMAETELEELRITLKVCCHRYRVFAAAFSTIFRRKRMPSWPS